MQIIWVCAKLNYYAHLLHFSELHQNFYNIGVIYAIQLFISKVDYRPYLVAYEP